MPKDPPSKEFAAFDGLIGKLLKVRKSELKERMDAHKAKAAQNPNKRGPKPKSKASASTDA